MISKISKYKSKLIKRKKLLAAKVIVENSTDTSGVLICSFTKNNIKTTLTNETRDKVWFWTSSGKEKLKSQQKITSLAVKNISSSIKAYLETHKTQVKTLEMVFKGFNRLSEELILEISRFVLVTSLSEESPVRFGGCRLRGQRKR